MNVQPTVIREFMVYEFELGDIAAEATKIFVVRKVDVQLFIID